jgi:hypothetical protein
MTRTGRARLAGEGAWPRQYKRQAVSYEFKLRVVQYLDHEPMKAAIARFSPDLPPSKVKDKRRLCYSWKEARGMIEAKCAGGARQHCRDRSRGIGTTLTLTAEEQLVRWVNDLRADGVPVTALMLKLQSQELVLAQGTRGFFAASWTWRKHFLRRHKLSIRRRTREGQTTPADAEQAAVAFG